MGLPLHLEKRFAPRKTLTGLLPGSLLDHRGRKSVPSVDLSSDGLGIVTDARLELGQTVYLRTHNQHIELDLVWSKPDFGKKNLFRYGLQVKGEFI